MDGISWSELEAFVREEIGLRKSKPLSPATRMWEDLGQTGDDANEFMEQFFERFDVDTGDFDFHRYFLMEGEVGLYSLFQRLILGKPRRLNRQPITLAMLHRAALERRWDSRRLVEL